MKKALALVLSLLLLLAAVAGCSKPNTSVEKEPDVLEDGVTYDSNTYLPIVKTPIVLEALLSDNGTQGDYSTRTLWKDIEDTTGITIDPRITVTYGDGEAASLIFASRDYPDISFRLDCANHASMIEDAIATGDILELSSELMAKYAPNWSKTFEENPDIYLRSVHTDGKLYGLPNIEMQESAINLRDCFLINANWLDELGMDKPTTIDEYTAYLRNLKNAAGTGSIPTNVEPLYARQWVSTNAGMTTWWGFLDMNGAYNGFAGEYVVDGKTVANNYVNPDIKVPIKYVASLYQEGLISKTSLQAAYDTYIIAIDESHTATTPWYVGSYFGYWCCDHDFMAYLEPLTFSTGNTPVVRGMGMDNRLSKDNFFIFATCKYPIAALRLADTYASEEGTLRMSLGEVGYVYEKMEDGTYKKTDTKMAENWDKYGLYNYGPGFTAAKTITDLNRDTANDGKSRDWAYENIYKNYLPENKQLFPAAALAYLTSEEQIEVSNLQTKVDTIAKSYVGNWIFGRTTVDDTWDTYCQKIADVGNNRLLELKQKAWDAYSANIIQ